MNVTPMPIGQRLRSLLAFSLVCVLLVLAYVSTAQADPPGPRINSKIVVRITQLSKTDGQQQSVPGQVYRWGVMGMNFTWDATQADPQPGDSFVIELPKGLRNRMTTGTRVLLGANGIQAGECVLESRRILCTFSDNIRGYVNIHGKGRAELVATETSTETQTTITVNGEVQSVPLPGGEAITEPPAPKYWEAGFAKYESTINPGQPTIYWSIWFNPSVLLKKWTGQTPITSMTFTDIVGEGHHLCFDKCVVKLNLYRHKLDPSQPEVTLADSAGKSTDGFSLSVTPDPGNPKQFTVHLTGPFETHLNGEANYRIVYQTRPASPNGQTDMGQTYTNKVTLADYPAESIREGSVRETLDVTAQMEQGFGGFSLQKTLSGSGAGVLPAQQRYRFLINWTLPDGKTAQNYPNWAPPTSNPAEFIIEETGKAVPYPLNFPIGTRITVTEDTQALPHSVGATLLEWGQPSYMVGTETAQGSSPTFTIRNQTVTTLAVTNPVKQKATFAIRKGIQGIDPALIGSQKYTFRYECGGESGTIDVPATNESVPVGKNFAPGTQCVITEVAPAPNHLKDHTFTVPEKQTLTLEAGQENLVSFTNVYQRMMGRFSIIKKLDPTTPAEVRTRLADQPFPFTYNCGGTDTNAAVKIGQVWTSPELPVGSECTVKENTAAAPRITGYSLVAPPEQKVTIAAGTAPLELTFTNAYELERAHFTLSKLTGGDGAVLAPQSYSFTYTCDPLAVGLDSITGTLNVTPGTPVRVKDLPLGRCTVTESAVTVDHVGHLLSWMIDGQAAGTNNAPLSFDLSTKGTDIAINATNTYTRERAPFSVLKHVTGDGPFSADTFEIAYECRVPGANAINGTVKVPGNGMPVTVHDNLPVGTECVVSESAATKNRAGYEVQTQFVPLTALRIDKGRANTVEITNTYRALVGGFSIEKVLSGDGAGLAPTSFTFDYTCTADAGKITKGEATVVPGRATTIPSVPAGQCEVRESPNLVNGTTLSSSLRVGATSFDEGVATFTVADKVTVEVLANNTYTLKRGELAVKKVVKGAADEAIANHSFIIDYSCSGVEDPVKGSLVLKGNGKAVTISNLPYGTSCFLQERAQSASLRGYTLSAPQPTTVTISEVAANIQVEIVNSYTPEKPAPNPPIARTGLNGVEIIGALAAGLIAVGGGLIALRRRRR